MRQSKELFNQIREVESISLSKKDISNSAKNTYQSFISGNINAEQLAKKIKAFEEFLKELKSLSKEEIVSEIQKYGKEGVGGVKVKETGIKYDYEACNDIVYNRLKEQLKNREAMLKTIKEPKSEIDESTGEVYIISPPIKTSTTSYEVRLTE